jgi:hypothetical protein
MQHASEQKQYVLVIKNRRLALGPFASPDEAEYAAMGYYGTAITGASAPGRSRGDRDHVGSTRRG